MAKAEQSLGEIIRVLRETNHLSVRTLASKAGFSASFISQVENSQASPSIASLERIASALGVTVGDFFRTAEPDEASIVRSTDRRSVQSEWSRAKLEALVPPGPGTKLEPVIITIAPGGSSGKQPHARAVEQLVVVFEGELLLTLDDQVHSVQRGDAVSIPANTLHRWQNKSNEGAQIIVITPREGR